MRIDGGFFINDFINKNLRQYTIPVYQRNYEWSSEQCEKLFGDIIQAYKQDRHHFTGSVVDEKATINSHNLLLLFYMHCVVTACRLVVLKILLLFVISSGRNST